MPCLPVAVVAPSACSTDRVGTDPAVRLTRGGSAAITSTFIALMSHVAAGGAVPGALGIIVPLLISFSLCSVLAGVRLHWVRLSVSVVVSQALFHTLFVLGTGSGAGPAVASGHHMDPTTATTLLAGHGTSAHVAHSTTAMPVAHVVAAAVTVLALRRGEVVVARLRQAMGRLVTLARPAAPAAPPVVRRSLLAPVRWVEDRAPHVLLLALGCLTRRGPPGPAVPAHR